MRHNQSDALIKLAKDIIKDFDGKFRHIELKDIWIARIPMKFQDNIEEKDTIIVKPSSPEFEIVLNYRYCMMFLPNFDYIGEKEQARQIFRALCRIPRDYKENKGLIKPDRVFFSAEIDEFLPQYESRAKTSYKNPENPFRKIMNF